MRVDEAGWLEINASGLPPVVKIPSVRSTLLEEKRPLGMVWHWTGGHSRNSIYARALAEEIRTYNAQKDRAASWHVLIAKDGTIFQSLPLNVGSWHCGRPGRIGGKPTMTDGKWDASAWTGKLYANINRVTLGVELCNAGQLKKVDGKFYCWPFWPDDHSSGPDPELEIEAERAVMVNGQWYDDFPQAQCSAAQRVLTAAVIAFKWTREVSQYGHIHFDPSRKEDPGPVWLDSRLPTMLDSVFGAG